MLAGAKDQSEFNAYFLGNPGDAFINLNKYLVTNRLQKGDSQDSDPRSAARYYQGILERWLAAPPPREGVEKILMVGAQIGSAIRPHQAKPVRLANGSRWQESRL